MEMKLNQEDENSMLKTRDKNWEEKNLWQNSGKMYSGKNWWSQQTRSHGKWQYADYEKHSENLGLFQKEFS